MFVLGIDPGLSRCGYGCVESGRSPRAVAAGIIRTDPNLSLPHRLAEMQTELRNLIASLQPDVVAVERVLFQHNVRTAMGVGMASGLAMAEAITAGCEVVEFSPNEIKQVVAGSGSAGKDEVGDMVTTLLKLPKRLRPADAADAMAAALCFLAQAPQLRTQATVASNSGGRK
jgi:crossover junction endodeoxyribonuclease RuvC